VGGFGGCCYAPGCSAVKFWQGIFYCSFNLPTLPPHLPTHPPTHPTPNSYSKEILSRGRYAQLLAADNRAFSPDEAALFDRSAEFAYESFRNKAAESRGMEVEDMQVGGGVCRWLGWAGVVGVVWWGVAALCWGV